MPTKNAQGRIRDRSKSPKVCLKNATGPVMPGHQMAEEKFYIAQDESAQLRAYCHARSITLSALVRTLVVRWMDRQKEIATDRERERARLREIDNAIARADAQNV